MSNFSENAAHQVFTLTLPDLVWQEKKCRVGNHWGTFWLLFFPPPPPTRTRISGSVLKVPVEGLSTAVPTAWLTGASGDAGKDGGESEQEWRCAHGRLQGGGGQQVGHKLVSWLFLIVERRRQTSGVLYFNMCPVSLGRCLPTKATVMISVWQEREVKSASFILRPWFSHS